MQEWLNWHAWKACEPLKGSAGSNPALSAKPDGLAIAGPSGFKHPSNTDNHQVIPPYS